MKKRRGIVWAPVLIMIGAVVATGIVYLWWRFDHYTIVDVGNVVVNQSNSNVTTYDKSQYCYEPWYNDVATLTCDRGDVGWHYVAATDRCVYFKGSGCSISRFSTGKECGRVCGTSNIDSENP